MTDTYANYLAPAAMISAPISSSLTCFFVEPFFFPPSPCLSVNNTFFPLISHNNNNNVLLQPSPPLYPHPPQQPPLPTPGDQSSFPRLVRPPSPNFTYFTYLPPLSVAKYSIKTGLLALEHDHTYHRQHEEEEEEEGEEQEEGGKIKKTDKIVIALVDIKLVRGSMKATDTMRGGWVNVVGYIQREQKEREKEKGGVRVQALMVWSAEGVRLGEYESAVEEREKLG